MSALPAADECRACGGRGEVYSGQRERATNAPIGVPCFTCGGTGTSERLVCDMCNQPISVDAICPHRSSNLCPACSMDVCGDCRSLAPYVDEYDRDQAWLAS